MPARSGIGNIGDENALHVSCVEHKPIARSHRGGIGVRRDASAAAGVGVVGPLHVRCERRTSGRVLASSYPHRVLLFVAALLISASLVSALPSFGPFGARRLRTDDEMGFRRQARQQQQRVGFSLDSDSRGGAIDANESQENESTTESIGKGERKAPFPLSFLAAFGASMDAKEEASTEDLDARKNSVLGRTDRPLQKGLPYGGGGGVDAKKRDELGDEEHVSDSDNEPSTIVSEAAQVKSASRPRVKDDQRRKPENEIDDEPGEEKINKTDTVLSRDTIGTNKKYPTKPVASDSASRPKELGGGARHRRGRHVADGVKKDEKGGERSEGKERTSLPLLEIGAEKRNDIKEAKDSSDAAATGADKIRKSPKSKGRKASESEGVKLELDDEASETVTGIPPDKGNITIPPAPPAAVETTVSSRDSSPYVSSGYWQIIDKVTSFGMSTNNSNLRVSRHLRVVRKAAASATGLHGIMSGKGRDVTSVTLTRTPAPVNATSQNEGKGGLASGEDVQVSVESTLAKVPARKPPLPRGTRARRLAQIVFLRRRNDNNRAAAPRKKPAAPRKKPGRKVGPDPSMSQRVSDSSAENERVAIRAALSHGERRRRERVKEIDLIMSKRSEEMLELQCEKDDLQRRPNPLFNYTVLPEQISKSGLQATIPSTIPRTSRVFNFPPPELASEYIDELVASGRLIMLNHTQLWQSGPDIDEDEDEIGDDLLTPSADVRRLYENADSNSNHDTDVNGKPERRNGAEGGSWLLRQSLGGKSLGEKIGEATEIAAYKAVCSAIMSILARSISALHGVNVMTHSDIRLFVESAPDLPPLGKSALPDGDSYAEEALRKAIRKSAKRRKKRSKHSSRSHGHDLSEEAFIQRDAVVETLISHCQISAPLVKLFPLTLMRALLGNIITLVAAVVSDFADGIKIQILGHMIAFSFKPITESDMIQHIGMGGDFRFNHRRAKPEEFEAAVRATAQDVSESLEFLDRWHERALGSGILRAQIGNLIARVVLTLVDEVLSGAKFDLWSAQAGGPRIVAGLEYRVENDIDAANDVDSNFE